MKKSKAVSLLLSLSLLVSTAIPGTLALPVYAAGDGDEKKGMEISKTAAMAMVPILLRWKPTPLAKSSLQK